MDFNILVSSKKHLKMLLFATEVLIYILWHKFGQVYFTSIYYVRSIINFCQLYPYI